MFTGIHICGNSVAFGGGCLVERAVEDTVCILEMTTLWYGIIIRPAYEKMTEDCVSLSLYNADRHMGAVKEIDCPGFCLYNVTEWWCGTIPCLLYHPTMVWYHCRVGVRDGHDLATASLEHMFLMMTNNMFVSQRLSFHESSQAKDRNMTPRL